MSFDKNKKENKKTLPKSFPLLSPSFASLSEIWPQHSPPALSPYTTLSLFPRDQLVVRGKHENDALGAAIRGARALFVKCFYDQDGCNILILSLNTSSFDVPIHCIFVSFLLNASTFKYER